jgi:hypothetical protein
MAEFGHLHFELPDRAHPAGAEGRWQTADGIYVAAGQIAPDGADCTVALSAHFGSLVAGRAGRVDTMGLVSVPGAASACAVRLTFDSPSGERYGLLAVAAATPGGPVELLQAAWPHGGTESAVPTVIAMMESLRTPGHHEPPAPVVDTSPATPEP